MPHNSARVWARASVVAFILFGIALMLFMDFMVADLRSLPFLRDDLPIPDSELHVNHFRLIVGAVLVTVTGGMAFLSFLVWEYLATANVRALAEGVRSRPVMAVVSWLVPGLNLILPALVVAEVWRASDPEGRGDEWRRRWTHPLVWAWWLSWLGAAALAVLALGKAGGPGATPTELIDRDHIGMVAAGAGIVVAVLSIALVVSLTRRQVLKEDRVLYPDWAGWSGRGSPATR